MRILVLALISAQAFFAWADGPSKRPPEVLTLTDQARALPAEFRADTLLRIASSSLITDVSWKRELIEEAYWSGAHASMLYAQNADGRSDSVDANSVRANRLEGLSLQTRAVQAMLGLDPEKALHLFEQIQPINLPKLSCSTVITPNVVDYYQTGANIFANSFIAKQRTNGDDLHFLQRLVTSIESPVQVPPVLEMIFAVKIPPVQRHEVLTLFAASLQDISRSDREYGAAENALTSAMTLERMQTSDAAILLPALRPYIVRHVSARRCTDNLPANGTMAISAVQFNSLADKFDPDGSRYKSISAEEAKTAGDAGTYQQNLMGKSAPSQAVNDGLRWLTHGGRSKDGKVLRWTLAERSSEEWRAHYDDTAKLVHDLKDDDESSPEAFFCVKADALNLLATLPPPGPVRDKAMDEYREFMEEHYASVQNPNLWFTMFRHMLYTARFSDDPKAKDWILDKLSLSSNPIIALYAKLEIRLGPPEQTYPPSHVQSTPH